jgi:zinc and cadmium transporter
METLIWILIATFVVGLISLVGAFSLFMKDKTLGKILMILVAFSAGALLSGGFFHLMVESLDHLTAINAFSYLIIGFVVFFIIERILHWHHCHEPGKCDTHPFTYLILIGDGAHNLIDGMIIAASFIVSIPFGIVTTILIIGHEIPQELGNFGSLVYGGFSKTKALIFNFAAQLTCIAGGLIGYFFSTAQNFSVYLLPFAAGGFFYIAASDLIPELHKEKDSKKSFISFAFFLIGIIFMFLLKILFAE